jgi:hypothetical protein
MNSLFQQTIHAETAQRDTGYAGALALFALLTFSNAGNGAGHTRAR